MEVFVIIFFLGIIIAVAGVLVIAKRNRILYVILAIVMVLILASLGFFLFWVHMDRDRVIANDGAYGVIDLERTTVGINSLPSDITPSQPEIADMSDDTIEYTPAWHDVYAPIISAYLAFENGGQPAEIILGSPF